jgi:hypothetical protein
MAFLFGDVTRRGAPLGEYRQSSSHDNIAVTMALLGPNSSHDPTYWEYNLAWNRSICTFPRVWNFLMEFLYCQEHMVEIVAAV